MVAGYSLEGIILVLYKGHIINISLVIFKLLKYATPTIIFFHFILSLVIFWSQFQELTVTHLNKPLEKVQISSNYRTDYSCKKLEALKRESKTLKKRK